MTTNYCYRCGRLSALNIRAMCPPCQTMWFGLTFDARRALIRLVVTS